MGKSKDLATSSLSSDLTVDTNTFHVDVADNRVGIGTTAPTNQLTITDGTATPYGVEDEVLLDIKRATTNTAANKATAIRLGNISNGARLSYGGASDTMNIIMGSGNITATFRNDGGMTLPYQPAFMAYGSATYANRGNGAIEYSTAVFNQGNHYSTSTYTFTAPVSGVYHFSAGAIAHATSTASGGIFIEQNSTHLFKDYQETGTRNRTVSGTAYCAANDAIKVRIESSGSGGDYYYLGAGYGWFSGHLVG